MTISTVSVAAGLELGRGVGQVLPAVVASRLDDVRAGDALGARGSGPPTRPRCSWSPGSLLPVTTMSLGYRWWNRTSGLVEAGLEVGRGDPVVLGRPHDHDGRCVPSGVVRAARSATPAQRSPRSRASTASTRAQRDLEARRNGPNIIRRGRGPPPHRHLAVPETGAAASQAAEHLVAPEHLEGLEQRRPDPPPGHRHPDGGLGLAQLAAHRSASSRWRPPRAAASQAQVA